MQATLGRLLLNPFLLLAVIVAAIITGLQSPQTGKFLAPIGGYYISLLQMIILPYLFVTITSGVARMASDPSARQYIRRMVLIYPAAMILTAAVALTWTFILPPGGTVDGTTMSALGGIVSGGDTGSSATGVEITLSGSETTVAEGDAFDLLDRFIPENIFAALSSGDSLKTVIFCIVFGAALAHTSGSGTTVLMTFFSVVQQACTQVVRWLNLMLPFALFAMLSAQVATVGVGPLFSLLRFIQVQALAGGTLLIIAIAIISYRARVSPSKALSHLADTIIMAVSTRSSLTCIPIAVRELTENLRFDKNGINLVLPLGITMCRIATVSYLLIGTVFIAQVYGVEIDARGYATIFIASIAAGLAASGATGAMAVMLISLVAEPMKLPVEAAIVLFIAIDPVIDVIRTLVLVYGNCALAAVIVPRPQAIEDARETADLQYPAQVR